ncbi:MAG: TlpA disulfide reductase family protein [Pirellulales bacterium]
MFPDDAVPQRGGATSAVLTLFGLIMVALIGVSLAALFLSRQSDRTPGEATSHQAVGLPMPGLRVQPIDDLATNVDLVDVAGQVVLVNFWGTWCPPCRTELPHMDALYKQYRDDPRFRLFAVSCGNGSSENLPELAEETAGFLKHFGYDLPAYVDADFATRQMLAADPRYIPEFAFPTTVVADANGIIRAVWVGYRPGFEDEMAAEVRKLLAETTPEADPL